MQTVSSSFWTRIDMIISKDGINYKTDSSILVGSYQSTRDIVSASEAPSIVPKKDR